MRQRFWPGCTTIRPSWTASSGSRSRWKGTSMRAATLPSAEAIWSSRRVCRPTLGWSPGVRCQRPGGVRGGFADHLRADIDPHRGAGRGAAGEAHGAGVVVVDHVEAEALLARGGGPPAARRPDRRRGAAAALQHPGRRVGRGGRGQQHGERAGARGARFRRTRPRSGSRRRAERGDGRGGAARRLRHHQQHGFLAGDGVAARGTGPQREFAGARRQGIVRQDHPFAAAIGAGAAEFALAFEQEHLGAGGRRGRPSPACRGRRPGRRRTGARPAPGGGGGGGGVAPSGRRRDRARPAGCSEDGPAAGGRREGFGKHEPRRAYRGCRDQGDEPHALRERRFQHHRGPGAPARTGRAIEGARPGQTTSLRCETCHLAGRASRRACRSIPARHNRCGARSPASGRSRTAHSNHVSSNGTPPATAQPMAGPAACRRCAPRARDPGPGRRRVTRPRSSRRRRRGPAPVPPRGRRGRAPSAAPIAAVQGAPAGKPPSAAATPAAARTGQGPERRAIHSAASSQGEGDGGAQRRAQFQRGDGGGGAEGQQGHQGAGGDRPRLSARPPATTRPRRGAARRRARASRRAWRRGGSGGAPPTKPAQRQQRQALGELARRGDGQAERHRPAHRQSQGGAERGEVAAVQEAQQPGPGERPSPGRRARPAPERAGSGHDAGQRASRFMPHACRVRLASARSAPV